MVVYLCQTSSPNSSHPPLPPQICISNEFPVRLMLLAQAPHFENHYFKLESISKFLASIHIDFIWEVLGFGWFELFAPLWSVAWDECRTRGLFQKAESLQEKVPVRLRKAGSVRSSDGRVQERGRLYIIFFQFFLYYFYYCYYYFWLRGMRDLSSPTRDRTHAPCSGSTVFTTGPPGKSQGLTVLCSFIWVLVTWLCAVCGNSLNDPCTFLRVCYTSVKNLF